MLLIILPVIAFVLLAGGGGILVYRIFFHPLAGFGGPFLAKISGFYGAWYSYKGELHVKIEKAHLRYGPVFRISPNKLSFNTTSALHDIYNTGNVYKCPGQLAMGTNAASARGLLTTVDKIAHGKQRRILNQGFTAERQADFSTNVHTHVDRMAELLSTYVDDNLESAWSVPINMTGLFRRLAWDIMGEFIYGTSLDTQIDPTNWFLMDAVTAYSRWASVCMFIPQFAKYPLKWILDYHGTKAQKKGQKGMKELEKSRMNVPFYPGNDLPSYLLEAFDVDNSQRPTVPEIWTECHALMFKSAEPIATCLASLFFYLSGNKIAYRRVTKEILSSFVSEEHVRWNPTLNSCRYLRACIDEAMRMSPPICSEGWRTSTSGLGSYVDGHEVPFGTGMSVSTYALHHNPLNYLEPHMYRPERWLGNDLLDQVVSLQTFAPYSVGDRSCPGRPLATIVILTAAARIIFTYDFRRAPGLLGQVGSRTAGLEAVFGWEMDFDLRSHLSCTHEGPMLEFQKRLLASELMC